MVRLVSIPLKTRQNERPFLSSLYYKKEVFGEYLRDDLYSKVDIVCYVKLPLCNVISTLID